MRFYWWLIIDEKGLMASASIVITVCGRWGHAWWRQGGGGEDIHVGTDHWESAIDIYIYEQIIIIGTKLAILK